MRIALGSIGALVVIIGLLWWRLDTTTERAIEAETRSEALEGTVKNLREYAYNAEQATIEARRRDERSRRESDAARKLLERLKNENANLREYLSSHIPSGVACWMQQTDSEDRSPPASGQPAGADPEACKSIQPTHESGWGWCRELEKGFDRCESDKRLIKEFYDNMGVGDG